MKKLNVQSKELSDLLGYKPTLGSRLRWFWQFNVRRHISYQIRDFYWLHIRTIWRPQHSRIRKAVPKYWMDLDHVLQNVCFEVIKSFYEDEYMAGIVDWEGTGGKAVEFTEWLEDAYKYITADRPALEKRIDKAYPNYKKVEKLETEMEDLDTKVMIDLVKWRRHMWT